LWLLALQASRAVAIAAPKDDSSDDSEDAVSSRPSIKVLVIGGGVAGLACAQALGASTDVDCCVKVLEARSRLGGRVHTYTFPAKESHGEEHVDLGANYIVVGGFT